MEQKIIIEKITSYTDYEYKKVCELVKALDVNSQDLSQDDYKKMIANSGTHLFVAKDEDEVVGMVTLIIYRIPYKVKAQLEDLIVQDSMRGKGIGAKLISHAVRVAQEEGVKSLNLTSRPDRAKANLLYQRLGFYKRDTNVYRIDL